MIRSKTILCLLVTAVFLIPISAVNNEVITVENSEIETDVPSTILTVGCNEEGDDPEITDDEGDTLFDYIDVLWASFYEESNEPEYLYVALKIANLKDKIGCVYAVHWYYDDVHYDTAFRNGVFIPRMDFKSWRCDFYILRTPIDTWNESYNSGSFDLETGIITWRIHKSCMGDPQPGDVLTQSYVFTAQRISKLGLIPLRRLFRSFSDSTDSLESEDYIIQY